MPIWCGRSVSRPKESGRVVTPNDPGCGALVHRLCSHVADDAVPPVATLHADDALDARFGVLPSLTSKMWYAVGVRPAITKQREPPGGGQDPGFGVGPPFVVLRSGAIDAEVGACLFGQRSRYAASSQSYRRQSLGRRFLRQDV